MAILETSPSELNSTGLPPAGAVVPSTRREARAALQAQEAAARRRAAAEAERAKREARQARKAEASVARVASTRPSAAKQKRGVKPIASVFVMLVAAGTIGTCAIPAYAFNPKAKQQSGTTALHSSVGTQSVSVAANAKAVKAKAESYTATTASEIARAAAKEKAAQARQQIQAYHAAYSGPSASDYLKNPPYPNFSLSQVFSVATKYIGTPYVYGGATPAGFDCSGFTMFVYAQFGIALPHSVSSQAALGTRISQADAVPGDLVVMPGHIGFYAGGGRILDAPETGKRVQIRPIWTSNYYIVRIGI